MKHPEPPFTELGFYLDLGPREAIIRLLEARLGQGASLGAMVELTLVKPGLEALNFDEEYGGSEVPSHDLDHVRELAHDPRHLVRRIEIVADGDREPELAVLIPRAAGNRHTHERNPVAIWADSDLQNVRLLSAEFTELIGVLRPLYATMGVEATIVPPSELAVDVDPGLFASGYVSVPRGVDGDELRRLVEELRGSWSDLEDGIRFDLPGAFGRRGRPGPIDRDARLGALVARWFR
jgi:hypothetical protein